MPPRRGQAGHAFLFTLLLIALLSVSLLVASEIDSTLVRRQREQALLQAGHEFREALKRYQAGRTGVLGGQYPLELEELLLDRRYPTTVRHLRRAYADPISGKAEWGYVRQGGRIVGMFSLSKLKPIKQDGFDPDDGAFRVAQSYRDWVFTYPPVLGQPAPAGAASAPSLSASGPAASFGPVPVPGPPAQR